MKHSTVSNNNSMSKTPFSFTATIYKFTGPTFIGPDEEMDLFKDLNNREGIVISMNAQVDPKGLYLFVSTGKKTYTVSKKTLEKVKNVPISWERKAFMTAVDELKEKLAAMDKYLNEDFVSHQ